MTPCVVCRNAQRDVALWIDKHSVAAVVHCALAAMKICGDEVSVTFVSDRVMRLRHRQVFGDSSSTDCITVPLFQEGDPYIVLGDIIVCPKTALSYVRGKHEDFWRELTLYVVHGVLHIAGITDDTPEARRIMRTYERRVMRILQARHISIQGVFKEEL